MKSTTCFSKTTKNPLSVYTTEAEAQQSADYQLRNGRSLYAYRCERCGLWHLAPTASRINVLHKACRCEDSFGKSKDLYVSREDAEKARRKRESEGAGQLYIYECPHGRGYHLTHKEPWD
ncbi:hypothetical protein [Fibrobacter sp.]|uniref:hypothetical protein n=1 Tax=Fibrobacter sp. TaxID=35828 RepID=UPI0026281949|nr:hypothetical protein [Fibrobacter sp.]MDD7496726.1 hypothetical protein [Fibrobacter sp.]MDY5724125.1 hypothetical protein [Fibrobacter sp.]